MKRYIFTQALVIRVEDTIGFIKKNRKASKTLAIVILVLSAFMIGNLKSSDTVQASDNKEKKVMSIQIKDGDTYWSIAKKYADSDKYDDYNDYIKEVKEINHISGDYLKAGGYLIVPYYS